MASWLGIGLGVMWLWLGWQAIQPTAVHNAIFNPVLILDGALAIAASILIAKKSQTVVLFATGYAVAMEIYLQIYQLSTGKGLKFKPYFGFELLALLLANIGVFWCNLLDKDKNSPKKVD